MFQWPINSSQIEAMKGSIYPAGIKIHGVNLIASKTNEIANTQFKKMVFQKYN